MGAALIIKCPPAASISESGEESNFVCKFTAMGYPSIHHIPFHPWALLMTAGASSFNVSRIRTPGAGLRYINKRRDSLGSYPFSISKREATSCPPFVNHPVNLTREPIFICVVLHCDDICVTGVGRLCLGKTLGLQLVWDVISTRIVPISILVGESMRVTNPFTVSADTATGRANSKR